MVWQSCDGLGRVGGSGRLEGTKEREGGSVGARGRVLRLERGTEAGVKERRKEVE